VLEVAGLDAGYGEAIVALLGPNGAGKSTLLTTIAGLVRARAGTIRWEGEELGRLSAHHIVERGVALVPEGRRLFGSMSVEDNLELGAFAPRARAGRAEAFERVFALFPMLRERRRQLVRALSGGQQQMVAVGRALMSQPKLLMLDEPSLGIAPRLVSAIFDALGAIHRAGVGVLLVEQNVSAALGLAHRAYVMEGGRIVRDGAARDLLNDPHIRTAYLGPLAARA
jgi:branched-chain amino acid transport system ATP-binding protein